MQITQCPGIVLVIGFHLKISRYRQIDIFFEDIPECCSLVCWVCKASICLLQLCDLYKNVLNDHDWTRLEGTLLPLDDSTGLYEEKRKPRKHCSLTQEWQWHPDNVSTIRRGGWPMFRRSGRVRMWVRSPLKGCPCSLHLYPYLKKSLTWPQSEWCFSHISISFVLRIDKC